eukprot:gene9509-12809_t
MSVSTYKQYKDNSAKFLSWIHDASNSITRNRQPTVPEIGRIVNSLVNCTNYLSLPFTLRSSFSEILNCCDVAIKLREKQNKAFESKASLNKEHEGHVVFVNLMKEWKKALQEKFLPPYLEEFGTENKKKGPPVNSVQVNGPPVNSAQNGPPVNSAQTNRFNVLESDANAESDIIVEDDFLNNILQSLKYGGEKSEENMGKASSVTHPNDFSFEEDMVLQLYCFLVDINDLCEKINETWLDVKKEKMSIITATAITTASITSVEQLANDLEMNFPTINSFDALDAVVREYFPQSFHNDLESSIMDQIQYYYDSNRTKVKSLNLSEGSCWFDLTFCFSFLRAFTTSIPEKKTLLHLKEGFFGPNYDENKNQAMWFVGLKSLTPIMGENEPIAVLLLKEFGILYNFIVEFEKSNANIPFPSYLKQGQKHLSGPFLRLFHSYINQPRAKGVSIALVFAVLCWTKSVFFLQNNECIKRYVSLAKQSMQHLSNRLDTIIKNGYVKKAHKELHDSLLQMQMDIDIVYVKNPMYGLVKAFGSNPYIAWAIYIDHLLLYLLCGCESLLVTSRFRAFGHLYNGLLRKGFMKHIPFVDKLCDLYSNLMFYPSRPLQAPFSDYYLLSSHLTVDGLHAMKKHNLPGDSSNLTVKSRGAMHIYQLSEFYRIFNPNFYKVSKNDQYLHPSTMEHTISGRNFLMYVQKTSNRELLESRVLSRDLFAIHDELEEIFEELTNILNRRDFYHTFVLNETLVGQSRQYRINRAAEDSVMYPLIRFLDMEDLDKVIPSYALLDDIIFDTRSDTKVNCKEYCQRAATYITSRFKSYDIQKTFFILSNDHKLISPNFGLCDVWDDDKNDRSDQPHYNSLAQFAAWMDRFEDNPSPLTHAEIEIFKSDVMYDPYFISHFCPELKPTILRHLVTGPHENIELVEWCINMGGLSKSEIYYKRLSAHFGFMAKIDCTRWPVADAVICGKFDMVKLIIEAENGRHINHAGESDDGCTLVQLAVKYNHENIYDYFKVHGADLSILNSKRERIVDLVHPNNPSFKATVSSHYQDYLKLLDRVSGNRSGLLMNEHEKRRNQALSAFKLPNPNFIVNLEQIRD